MRLWILSDLHLESTRGWDLPPVGARPSYDVMVAAGDIIPGMERGVRWLADRVIDKPVVYVAGNHESYGTDIDRTVEKAREAARGTSIRVLQDDIRTGRSLRVKISEEPLTGSPTKSPPPAWQARSARPHHRIPSRLLGGADNRASRETNASTASMDPRCSRLPRACRGAPTATRRNNDASPAQTLASCHPIGPAALRRVVRLEVVVDTWIVTPKTCAAHRKCVRCPSSYGSPPLREVRPGRSTRYQLRYPQMRVRAPPRGRP